MIKRTIDEILRGKPDILTGRQIRAARALVGLSRRELADFAGISERTISSIEDKEDGPVTCQLETMIALLEALWQSGVLLKENEGVERRLE